MEEQNNSQREEFEQSIVNEKTDGYQHPSDFWRRTGAVALAVGMFVAGY